MLQSLALWNPSFTSAMQTELETGDSPFTIFNFSNVDSNNYPASRTCIFRGFLFDQEKTNVLMFTTDKRSSKYKDLLLNPKFDACFYFHKLRKQFRFKGTVRVISDELVPIISYEASNFDNLNDNDNEDEESDSSADSNDKKKNDQQSLINQYLSLSNTEQSCKITEPLHYKLFSPKFVKSFEDSSVSLSDLAHSYTGRIEQSVSKTPTREEWESERLRVWNALSRNMKKTFRKPTPGSPLTEEKRKLLDAINRGVDGSNSSTGYENFVVVCMFVDIVDEVNLSGSGYDRRYIYRRTNNDTWKEHEVCP